MRNLKLYSVIILLLLCSFKPKKNAQPLMVKKQLLLVLDYHEIVDKNKKATDKQNVDGNIITHNYDHTGDHVSYSLKVFDSNKPLSENVINNDNVICNEISRNLYLTFYINRLGKSKKEAIAQVKEVINLSKLPSNTNFIRVKDIKKSFKLYSLNAICEQYILKQNSQTDTVYVLKKVKSIKPLSSGLANANIRNL